jgi:hypothetical protein
LPVPDTHVVRLAANHPVLTTETVVSPAQWGCLVAFGFPFVAIGSALAWAVAFRPDLIHQSEAQAMPKPWLYAVAGLFAGAGLLVWLPNTWGLIGSWRRTRRIRAHASEPWLVDGAWDPEGTRDHPIVDAVGSLVFYGYFALFLAPFNWWMWTLEETYSPGVAIVAVFDLILLAGLGYWAYTVGRSLRYGASRVAFEQFPFFLGQTLRVRLGCRGGLDRFDTLKVTVRFVKLRKDKTSDDARDRRCEQHWAEEFTFDRALLAGVTELPISLTLPTGDYGTQLSADPARYWEIEARGEAPGIDFLAHHLLPVYKAP